MDLRRQSRLALFTWLCAGCTATAADDPAPTFAELHSKVLAPGCVFSSCHQGAAAAGGLSLELAVAYSNLVDVQAVGAPDRVRVVPGDLDASYLLDKLENPSPDAGDPMPPTAPLSDTRLDMVRAWIEAGALND